VLEFCDIKLVGADENESILLQEMSRANNGRIKVNNTMIEEDIDETNAATSTSIGRRMIMRNMEK